MPPRNKAVSIGDLHNDRAMKMAGKSEKPPARGIGRRCILLPSRGTSIAWTAGARRAQSGDSTRDAVAAIDVEIIFTGIEFGIFAQTENSLKLNKAQLSLDL